MPYVGYLSRKRPNPLILESVTAINQGSETRLQKGEYFGFLLSRLVKTFLQCSDAQAHSFNSLLFTEPKRTKLANLADKLAAMLNRADVIEGAEELAYVIAAIYRGCLGEMEGVENANFGTRAYYDGIIAEIKDQLKDAKFDNTDQKSRMMSYRRYLLVRGVMFQVLEEIYRRSHSQFADSHMEENGDVWVNKTLVEVDA